jgi:hypothetical protein
MSWRPLGCNLTFDAELSALHLCIVEFSGGLMQAPNGKTYAIESNLPRDTIKAFAEDLELLK